MKRTFFAMVMAGSCLAALAQTTPATPTTPTNPSTPTNPTTPATPTNTQSPTTTQSTTTTQQPTTNQSTINNQSSINSQPTTTQPVTNSNTLTNSTTDPMSTTTNTTVNNPATGNTSTSWAPGTSPYWGWNSYGIWNNGNAANVNGNASLGNTSSMTGSTPVTTTDANSATASSGNANMSGSMTSTSTYDAYSGTAVASLPPNVQMNFSKEFPNTANNQYSWNQYGDWFHTHYTANGRMTQYFYDQRGNGYALSLPVIQTYVPEDVIDKALNKYGARLYSISMVKAADSGATYQLGLLERGQLRTEYLNEAGNTVANVWRTEIEEANMSSTSANAAMDNSAQSTTDATQADMTTTDDQSAGQKQMKKKWKENGVKTKVKADDNGNLKIKQKKIDD